MPLADYRQTYGLQKYDFFSSNHICAHIFYQSFTIVSFFLSKMLG